MHGVHIVRGEVRGLDCLKLAIPARPKILDPRSSSRYSIGSTVRRGSSSTETAEMGANKAMPGDHGQL